MNQWLKGLIDHADMLVGRAGRLASWLGLMMVLLVAFDVLARYLFAYGSIALQELEWHLLAAIALMGMSYTLHRGEEVRVDILYVRFGPAARRLVDLLTAALTVALSLIIIKLSLAYVNQSYALGEGSPDPGGLPYRFVLKALIPLGFVLLTIQAIVQFYRIATAAPEPDAAPQPTPSTDMTNGN
jgi:TRAP-type mannitol/chloroaromatic compound transport system permease small subunit